MAVRVSALRWRPWALVATWVAVAVRVGVGAGQGSGTLGVRACGRVAPSSVAALVFGHLRGHTDSGQRRVVVGIEAILFDFLPPRLGVVLLRLTTPPKENAGNDQQSDNNDRYDYSDGGLAARAQTTLRLGSAGTLQRCRVGVGRRG